MTGLFLQGGGAKGAFQAGAIEALYQNGVEVNLISATSIGAINGYFLLTGNREEMARFWNNIEEISFKEPSQGDKVIDNSGLIEVLRNLEAKKSNISQMYINYVDVKNSNLIEETVDIAGVETEEALDYISYSSLLPFIDEASRDTREILDKFKVRLKNGEYDGYSLDGGIVNNNFVSPLDRDKIDEIYLIGLSENYKVRDDISERYSKEDITVIKPDFQMDSTATLNFDGDFCRELYKKGYNITKKILRNKVK